MRIVLDTNVLARAFIRADGLARELLNRCQQPSHHLLVSPFLLAEVSRVLRYDRVRKAHRQDDAAIDRFVRDIEVGSTFVLPAAAATQIVPADPQDDPIVALAVDGKADVLCTRDQHLFDPVVLLYCSGHGIEILDDLELIMRLRSIP